MNMAQINTDPVTRDVLPEVIEGWINSLTIGTTSDADQKKETGDTS